MAATLLLPVALCALSIADEAPAQTTDSSLASVLSLLLPFCSHIELEHIGLVDKESAALCETEWRQRVVARFGALRFATLRWRKVFKLRSYLQRKVVDNVSARVYLMNTRGETTCFSMDKGKSMMCSRERAIVYNRCERMFDLSLRINRSIQEISALIGMVSVDEARGLLNEHINLMASVASLRSSLMFESELFQVFPAPVLLDANTLLRGTFEFADGAFLDSTTVMMQMWASIDGLIYRPLAPPAIVHAQDQQHPVDAPGEVDTEGGEQAQLEPAQPLEANGGGLNTGAPVTYKAMKLHELSGMTIHIDDNTLRYRLQQQDMCVNALVSNTYLLYLFNPLQFRPMDWTYEAVLYVGETRCPLPSQREGVFLNSNTLAMRVFLSYGKMPERESNRTGVDSDSDSDEDIAEGHTATRQDADRSGREVGTRGGEDSDPLGIPYDGEAEVFSFLLMATNRITRETREVANKATCFSLSQPQATSAAQVSPSEAPAKPTTEEEQQQDDEDESKEATKANRRQSTSSHERHVHLPYDAMICYSFTEDYTLQYIEFAIGFEAFLHKLGVSPFLPDDVAAAKAT